MKWPSVPLRDVAPPEPSRIRFHPDQEVWLLTLDQIESHTGFIVNKQVVSASKAGSSTVPFDNGNVLYSKLRPYLNKVIWPQEPGIATTELIPLRPHSDLLDCAYLTYYLRSNHFLPFAQQCVAGVKMPRIIMAKFWEYRLPLPPLSEQRRIVEILNQADTLRKKRVEADARAEHILPALFYKMFGDPATNPMGWEVTTLSKGGALVRYGLGQPPKMSPSGIPLIRATNIRWGTITGDDMMFVSKEAVPVSRNAFLSANEVIVVRSGAYTGDVAQVTEQWAGSVAGYDLVITPGERFYGEYIEACLLTPHIQKNYFGNLKARAGQPHLNAEQLLATPILCPPKDLQVCFANSVQRIRRLQGNNIHSKRRLNNLFAILLHQAFSGDLTVKWREAHMNELLAEMAEQAKALESANSPMLDLFG